MREIWLDWVAPHIRRKSKQWRGTGPKERRPRQRGEARASGWGGGGEKIQPQASQRREPASTTGWWKDEGSCSAFSVIPLCSAFCRRQHTHPQYLLLRCTTSNCLDCLRGIWWPAWEFVATLGVQSEPCDRALYGPACAFHPIGCLWLLPCVCASAVVYGTKLPGTFIATLVVLWSVSATDSLYQQQSKASIAWLSCFLHLLVSPHLLPFDFCPFLWL